MKTLAILSDTHGLLRPPVLDALAAADVILHAGDVNTPETRNALAAYGTLYMVRGNNDRAWAEDLPQHLFITIEGVRFFLVHKKLDVPKDLTDVDVIVYGHSHQYAAEVIDGVLWLNPGSCGRRRFDLEVTMCRMTVDKGQYRFEKVPIDCAPAKRRRERRP